MRKQIQYHSFIRCNRILKKGFAKLLHLLNVNKLLLLWYFEPFNILGGTKNLLREVNQFLDHAVFWCAMEDWLRRIRTRKCLIMVSIVYR